MLNISKIVILFIAMIVAVGFFVGAICLQVHISKNNKRGKFIIPIILFLMPIIIGVFIVTIGMLAYSATAVEGSAVTKLGRAIIVFPGIAGGALSFPCAIITLIIELVYRSKRKHITDEEVIDIQNL